LEYQWIINADMGKKKQWNTDITEKKVKKEEKEKIILPASINLFTAYYLKI
jgi:hypothetical protein